MRHAIIAGPVLLSLSAGGAFAQSAAAPPKPPTAEQGSEIRNGSSPDHGQTKAGEGTYGTSTSPGSMAPRPTQPTPTGQPPR